MGSTESAAARVALVVEPAIEAEGYSLVDLEYQREGGAWVLRIFIDKPDGVTLDDCQIVSRLIGPLLDVEDVIKSRYFLEVSSPGINRRIRKKADFERFAGSRVKIQLRSPIDGRRKIAGIIERVENDKVIIRDEREGSQQQKGVPLAAIVRANLQIM